MEENAVNAQLDLSYLVMENVVSNNHVLKPVKRPCTSSALSSSEIQKYCILVTETPFNIITLPN